MAVVDSAAAAAAGRDFKWQLTLAVCICHAAHLYFVTNIFSFGGLMCVDLGWAKSRDEAGYVAGYLQSANTLGRIPTATLWGILGDRFGYRCALLWTLAFILTGGICFGLATDFLVSVSSRLVFWGMCNGWMTLVVPICSTAGDRMMEVYGIVLGVGQLVQLLAPAVGGWTYSRKARFPAAAPSFIGAFLAAVAFALTFVLLPRNGSSISDNARSTGSSAQGRSRFAWCSAVVVKAQLLRASQGFLLFTLFDVVPLWAISSTALGGLELSEDELGVILAASGVVNIVFAVSALPRITKRFGSKTPLAVCLALSALCFAAIPWATRQLHLFVVHAVCSAAFTVTCAVTVVFSTNTIHPNARGAANGVAATLDALAKGLAPIVGANTFAWSLAHFGRIGRCVIFVLMALVQAACLATAVLLPASVEIDLANCEESGSVTQSQQSLQPLDASSCADGG